MEEINREINTFNVRVYALWIKNDALLILKEPYVGETLYKFPGGGVEYGEGLIEALKRELKEELNLALSHYEHFYTQETFVRSRFKENEQILTIYYKVGIQNPEDIDIIEKRIEQLLWIPLSELNTNHVNLPVDKKVVALLMTTLPKAPDPQNTV